MTKQAPTACTLIKKNIQNGKMLIERLNAFVNYDDPVAPKPKGIVGHTVVIDAKGETIRELTSDNKYFESLAGDFVFEVNPATGLVSTFGTVSIESKGLSILDTQALTVERLSFIYCNTNKALATMGVDVNALIETSHLEAYFKQRAVQTAELQAAKTRAKYTGKIKGILTSVCFMPRGVSGVVDHILTHRLPSNPSKLRALFFSLSNGLFTYRSPLQTQSVNFRIIFGEDLELKEFSYYQDELNSPLPALVSQLTALCPQLLSRTFESGLNWKDNLVKGDIVIELAVKEEVEAVNVFRVRNKHLA